MNITAKYWSKPLHERIPLNFSEKTDIRLINIIIVLDYRGDVIIAGYVFKVLSEKPPEVELTYVTRADLKGTFIFK